MVKFDTNYILIFVVSISLERKRGLSLIRTKISIGRFLGTLSDQIQIFKRLEHLFALIFDQYQNHYASKGGNFGYWSCPCPKSV